MNIFEKILKNVLTNEKESSIIIGNFETVQKFNRKKVAKMRVLKIGVGKGEVHEVNIDGTLEELQTLVDGYIEPCAPVGIKEHHIEFLANEEGLLKGLTPNENLFPFFFVGNVVVVGVSGDDFESLTDNQTTFIKMWLQHLEMC